MLLLKYAPIVLIAAFSFHAIDGYNFNRELDDNAELNDADSEPATGGNGQAGNSEKEEEVDENTETNTHANSGTEGPQDLVSALSSKHDAEFNSTTSSSISVDAESSTTGSLANEFDNGSVTGNQMGFNFDPTNLMNMEQFMAQEMAQEKEQEMENEA